MGYGGPVPGDPERPASARVYSYLLDQRDWYPADRDLATRLEAIYPGLKKMAKSNQAYLGHAVLWASARLGIRQYLDLGSGFPAASSVRDIAQAADPDALVACVDYDPIVAGPCGYGPVLAELGVKNVSLLLRDIRDIDEVLAAPEVGGLLDFTEPVMVVLGLVLTHMGVEDAEKVVKAYSGILTPGSAVAVTVTCTPDQDAAGHLVETWRHGSGTQARNYTPAELEALFDGLDVQPPGIGPIAGRRPGWKDARAETQGASYVIGGIAIKPLPQRQNKRPAR